MFKLRKNKYCCSWFSVYHKNPDTSDCIRVIKITSYSPKLMHIEYAFGDIGNFRLIKNSNLPFRFFLKLPMNPSNPRKCNKKDINGYMLSFCPFCGVNLYTYYIKKRNIEDYLNEIEGETI